MIEYDLKKNNNVKNEKAYGKYYAKPHVGETIDLETLADHMHGHNSPFSAGTTKGILTDAVTHIKELLLMGNNVKLDNLAIFYISIKNKMGAESEKEFSVAKNVDGVRMRARATGDFRSVNLNLEANLKKYGSSKKKKSDSTTDTDPGDDPENNPSSGGGSGSSTPDTGGSGTGGSGSSDGDTVL